MILNRRQKLSLILLLVALVALAVDKLLLLPGPADAAAATTLDAGGTVETVTGDSPAASNSEAAPTRERPAAGVVADALDIMTNTAVPDIFSWDRLGTAGGFDSADGSSGATSKSEFAASHALTATLLGPRPMAVIDGTTYRIGDRIAGFMLTEIRAGQAVFVSDSGTCALRVRKPWETDDGAPP